jgi:hypothetical protein
VDFCRRLSQVRVSPTVGHHLTRCSRIRA